jgi:type VI secretion system secreted protein Hcp
MSQNIYLKIENVKGEATEQTHKDEIEVLNWEWTQTIETGSSGPTSPRPGRPAPPSITFRHFIDRASPTLMKLCLTGQTLRSAILSMQIPGGTHPSDYFKLEMTTVTITGFSPTGEAGSNRPTETVTLTCKKIKEEYKYSPAGGSPVTTTEEYEFGRNA